MVAFNLIVVVILLVFYLYLLVKPRSIRRHAMFLLGASGLLVAIFGGLFSGWLGCHWANVLVAIFSTIGSLAAFGGVILACYGGKLQIGISQVQAEEGERK
jgi:hypothetical protein